MPRHLLVITFLIGTIIGAYACYERYTPDDKSLLNGDAGMTGHLYLSFSAELNLVYGKVTKPNPCSDPLPANTDTAVKEIVALIKGELMKSGLPEAAADGALIELEINNYREGGMAFGELLSSAVIAAEKLPKCYRFYLSSLTPDRAKAIEAIEALLALPPEERRPLSAVAYYRHGRLLEFAIQDDTQRNQAGKEVTVEKLQALRKSLAAVTVAIQEGSPDIAWIGAAARGWLADSYSSLPAGCTYMLEDEIDFRKAVDLCLELRAEGYPTGEDSLVGIIHLASKNSKALSEWCNDKDLRQLMTIYLSAGSGNWSSREREIINDGIIYDWLRILSYATKHELDENLVRIAILYYRQGEYKVSEQLLAKCPPDDVAAAMLRSRLELRLGRRVEATEALERALPGLEKITEGPSWSVDDRLWKNWDKSWISVARGQTNSADSKLRAELAMLKLALGQYQDALRLKMAAGLIWDARYVAECVMSIDELKAFVSAEAMVKHVCKRWQGVYDETMDFIDINEEIRVLLARRLCRAERWLEAKPFVKPGMSVHIDAYVGYVTTAQDTTKSNYERADAYWKAALLIREHGRELLYCDFGPRWTSGQQISLGLFFEGWYETDWPQCRFEPTHAYPLQPFTGAGADERQRIGRWLGANAPPGNRHNVLMKYRTFDLAMKAVELLPDNDEAAATIAQFVGVELSALDPMYANAAYKALAIRFKATRFGKEAFERRWFVKDYDNQVPPADLIKK